MIALGALVVAALCLSKAIGLSHSLSRENRDTALAVEAARRALERLRAQSFPNIFALYNSDEGDDPFGPGSAPGPDFAVRGLETVPGDADGLPGRILLPEVIGAGGAELREDQVAPALGMPRDLTGEGGIDGADHAGDYALLPVLVRVDWQSGGRTRRIELQTIAGDR
jgi:hypothetical protein